MSSENAAFVRGVMEAYRNPELMAQLADGELDFGWVDPEVEWDASVVLIRNQRQRGRSTGIWTDLPPYAQVFALREGKLVRWRTFPDQESALEAVGLTGAS